MTDEHWITTLYERYVQLFGDPHDDRTESPSTNP